MKALCKHERVKHFLDIIHQYLFPWLEYMECERSSYMVVWAEMPLVSVIKYNN